MIKFLILHCFYHHHFDAPSWRFYEILNITLVLPLLFALLFDGPNWWCYAIVNITLVLPLLFDVPRWYFHVIVGVGLTNIPMSPPGPPRTPKGPPRTPQGPPKAPQGPPRDPQDLPQGHPKLVILWKFMWILRIVIRSLSKILFV